MVAAFVGPDALAVEDSLTRLASPAAADARGIVSRYDKRTIVLIDGPHAGKTAEYWARVDEIEGLPVLLATGEMPVADDYDDQEDLPDQAGAGAVLTFSFASAVRLALVTSQGALLVCRATAGAVAPTATRGVCCFDGATTYIPCTTTAVKVFAPAGTTVSVSGLRRT